MPLQLQQLSVWSFPESVLEPETAADRMDTVLLQSQSASHIMLCGQFFRAATVTTSVH